jgi:regulator of nucleoside diphosphate kinase
VEPLITDADMLTVAESLEEHFRWPGHDRDAVDALRRKVMKAKVVPSDDIPTDVVTLRSRVRVTDLDTACDRTYTVVTGGGSAGAVSVLSPVGAALLGQREGDEVGYWEDVALRRLRIKRVLHEPDGRRASP